MVYGGKHPRTIKTDDDRPQPPDLQEWIAKYGGYRNIPWSKWDRRAYLGGPGLFNALP